VTIAFDIRISTKMKLAKRKINPFGKLLRNLGAITKKTTNLSIDKILLEFASSWLIY